MIFQLSISIRKQLLPCSIYSDKLRSMAVQCNHKYFYFFHINISICHWMESVKGDQTELQTSQTVFFSITHKDEIVSQPEKACMNNKPLLSPIITKLSSNCMSCNFIYLNFCCDQMLTRFHILLTLWKWQWQVLCQFHAP